MRTLQRAIVVLVGLAACDGPLDVTNVNNPDRDRVLRTPADVEALIGGLYQQFNDATIGGSNTALQPQLLTSGMESYSGNANFEMGPRGGIPRGSPHIPNGRGNPASTGNLRDFQRLSVTARSAANGLRRLATPGFSLGDPARDARGKAFAQFALGLSLGHLAMIYDSAAAPSPSDDPEFIPALQVYNDVKTTALGWLDSAVTTVKANAAIFGALPSAWLRGNTPDAAGFIRIIRSYRARIHAAVARTPMERRNSVNWDAVIADTDSGITADLNMSMDPSVGWNVVWPIQHYLFTSWHQAWQFILGMAADQASYDAWLGTPVANRGPFLVVTLDQRLPQGTTRAAQQAASGCTSTGCLPPTGNLYFRNRFSGDPGGLSLAFSFYDFYRFQAWVNAGRVGNYPVMTRAEMRLLAAEGHIYGARIAQAAALIDTSRIAKGGLPSLVTAGIADLTTPVPGGASCVPRVPQAPNFNVSACGNIFEALKWEKRMETAFIGYGAWYFDSRGWGDLPAGTALHWPVPWQEMDARNRPFYDMPPTPTSPGAAGPSTYGL